MTTKKISRRGLTPLLFATMMRAAGRVSIGCQTNAWKIDPKQESSLFEALKEIRSLGFDGFETGFRNLEPHFGAPAMMRKVLADSALEFFGIHIFLLEYDAETKIPPLSLIGRVAAGGASLGAKRLIVSGSPAATVDALKRKAQALEAAAKAAKAEGLDLAYHNHGPEMANGGREIEALLKDSGASLLVDAGHAYRAGMDLVPFVRKHLGRIAGLHLRDFRDDKQVPLGQGSFPLEALARELKALNWSGWVLAEEERLDGSKLGVAAAGPAVAALKGSFR